MDEGPRRDNPVRVEINGGWIAAAQHVPGDPPSALVTLRYRAEAPMKWPAYWYRDAWRCHGIGRASIPEAGKRLARRVLAKLPRVPT